MQRAGHTPAHSSHPMHFSMPSSYRLRTCRPWKRSGFGRFSAGYSVVRRGRNIWRNVTAKPFASPTTTPPLVRLRRRPLGPRIASTSRRSPTSVWSGRSPSDHLADGLVAAGHAQSQQPEHEHGTTERGGHRDPPVPALVTRHDHDAGHHHREEGELDEPLPPEVHELVIAQPWQRGAQPDGPEEE